MAATNQGLMLPPPRPNAIPNVAAIYPSLVGTANQQPPGPRPPNVRDFVTVSNMQHDVEQTRKNIAMRAAFAGRTITEAQKFLQDNGIRLDQDHVWRLYVRHAEKTNKRDLEAGSEPLTVQEQFMLDSLIDWPKYYEGMSGVEIAKIVADQQEQDRKALEIALRGGTLNGRQRRQEDQQR